MIYRQMDDHRRFLQRCHELALEAGQSGNTPVGALIVRDGVIVGEGIEATRPDNDITRHAEVEAIRDALKRLGTDKLTGCAMYTTHEPCILCSYVIRHYQISWVGFEHAVPAVGGVSSSWPILTAADIQIWTPPPVIETFKSPHDA
ncbi:nucleoside deaminase [Dyadobacter jiangsuensis]|nr:nucleoside deaminase [Dyadobacter jiangsuensis]